VTVIRIAPASTLKKAVRGRNTTKSDPRRQIAARIDHAAPTLAHVQSFPARMFARGRATSRPNAIHEQHASAVIVFQIVYVGLEARGIGDADAGTRTCFMGNDDAFVAIGIKRMWLFRLRLRSLRLLYLLSLLWLPRFLLRLLRILRLFSLRRLLRLLF
jgi:hypothetical protein